jgi:transcriptional regulator with XRE-family HTH domain
VDNLRPTIPIYVTRTTIDRALRTVGLTQKECAAQVGVSIRTLRRIIRAETIPDLEIVLRLTRVLNTPMLSLFVISSKPRLSV